jgi:hypothetical protein
MKQLTGGKAGRGGFDIGKLMGMRPR